MDLNLMYRLFDCMDEKKAVVDVGGHKCSSFTFYDNALICEECLKLVKDYATSAAVVVSDLKDGERSHQSMHGPDHEFFEEHSYSSKISFSHEHRNKAAPYSYRWNVWSTVCYKDRILSDLFRCLESVVVKMDGYKTITIEAKRLLATVVRDNVIRSNLHRMLCAYICVYVAMRHNGSLVDFDDFIVEFDLPVATSRKVLVLFLGTISNNTLKPLTDEEVMTIYRRRIGKVEDVELGEKMTLALQETELMYGKCMNQILKCRLALIAGLVLHGRIANPLSHIERAFPVGKWRHKCLTLALPSVHKALSAQQRTLYTYKRIKGR